MDDVVQFVRDTCGFGSDLAGFLDDIVLVIVHEQQSKVVDRIKTKVRKHIL